MKTMILKYKFFKSSLFGALLALTALVMWHLPSQQPGGLPHAFSAASLAADTQQPQQVAGSIEGTYGVDKNGSATYTIPIDIPPGRNHVQPKLSIVYNSGAGNGLLGQGFQINGLSAIARCPAEKALDNFTGTVNFDQNDRFCLDGERLIAVKDASGAGLTTIAAQNTAYGQNGTTYFTRHQTWSRIVSFTANEQQGPDSFRVTTKDGWLMSYNQPVKNPNLTSQTWLLGKVTDLNGNYYLINYDIDQTTGEAHPLNIKYTGNNRVTPSAPPQNQVQFLYGDRPDSTTHYSGGIAIKGTKRLLEIRSLSNGQWTKFYHFSYTTDNPTGRSLLTSIKTFGADGNWLPLTTFTWEPQVKPFSNNPFTVETKDLVPSPAPAEPGAPTQLYWYAADDDSKNPSETDPTASVTQALLIDVNGDGLMDYVPVNKGTYDIGLGNGDGAFNQRTLNQPISPYYRDYNLDNRVNFQGKRASFQDINGDGLPDIANFTYYHVYDGNGYKDSNAKFVYINSGNGFTKNTTYFNNSALLNHKMYQISDYEYYDHPLLAITWGILRDINGDGLPDYITNGVSSPDSFLLANGSGSGFEANWLGLPGSMAEDHKSNAGYKDHYLITKGLLMDINGDGLPDFTSASGSNKSFYINNLHPAPGTAVDNFVTAAYNLPGPVFQFYNNDDDDQHSIRLAELLDINGDRLTDYIKNDGTVYLNTGKSFVSTTMNVGETNHIKDTDNGNQASYKYQILHDFNNDGLPDILKHLADATHAKLALNTGSGFAADITLPVRYITFDFENSQRPRGTLTDINGDGFTDIVTSYYYCETDDNPDDAYRKNDCDKGSHSYGSNTVYLLKWPRNVIRRIDNGLGRTHSIGYKPLAAADYNKYPSRAETHDTYPVQYIRNSRYVVDADTVTDGRGNSYSKSYRYGGGRINIQEPRSDRWQGFFYKEEVVNQDAQTDQYTFTYYHQGRDNSALTGHIDSVITYSVSGFSPNPAITRKLHKTWYNYQVDTPFPNVYAVQKTAEHNDNYIGGVLTFTSSKTYTYDDYGNATTIADSANVDIPEETVFTHYKYKNDVDNWRLGYETAKKVTGSSTPYWNAWNAATDLSWDSTTYDNRMNVLSRKRYNAGVLGSWVGSTFGYDSYGNLTSITDARGSTATIAYDDDNHIFIASKTASTGGGQQLTTSFDYDPRFGALRSQTDANGVTLYYDLDGFGRTTAMWGYLGPDSLVKLAAYDLALTPGGGTQFTRHQPVWTNAADYQNWKKAPGTVITISGKKGLTPARWHTEKEYRDALQRLYKTESSGPQGNTLVKEKAYNQQGRLAQESMPYFTGTPPVWTTFSYNSDGLMDTTIVDPGGSSQKKTVTEYHPYHDNRDTLHAVSYIRRTVAADSAESATTLLYLNSRGKVVKRVDPNGGETIYVYDLLNRPWKIIDPGNVANITHYNSLGQKKSVTNPDMGTTTFSYDGEHYPFYKDETTLITDANQNQIFYFHDALGRIEKKLIFWNTPVSQLDTPNDSIFFNYDSTLTYGLGRLASVTKIEHPKYGPRKKNTYRYQYDAYGRLRQSQLIIDGESQPFVTNYRYLPNGQLVEALQPDQTQIAYRYHPDGSLDSLSGSINGSVAAAVGYDNYTAMGQASKTGYGNGIQSDYRYNEEGLLRAHDIYPQSDPTAYLMQNTYHWNSVYDLTKITDHIGDETQEFSYDNMSRLESASARGTYGTKTYAYDVAGNITLKDGNSYSYHPGTHRITGDQNGAFQYDYGKYDNGTGNITHRFGYSPQVGQTERFYIFDGENHLIQVNNQDPSDPDSWVSRYSYDHAGRLVREEVQQNGETTTTLHIGATVKKVIPPTGDATYVTYLSGPNGHEASISRLAVDVTLQPPSQGGAMGSLQQDFPGRSAVGGWLQVRWAALSAMLEAPGFSRSLYRWLIFITLGLGLAGGIWRAVRNRSQRPARYQPRPWITCLSPPLLVAVLLLSLFGSTAPLLAANPSQNSGSNAVVYYYHHDHIKSVSLITDESGAAVYRAQYTPYGLLHNKSGSQSQQFPAEFTGVEYDSPVNLYHFGARFYDPQIGRFISADTQVGDDPYSPHSFNRYAYSANNPVDDYDPSGHFIISLIVGAIVGAVISAVVESFVTEVIQRQSMSWAKLGTSLATGALGGAVGAGVGSIVGSIATRAFLTAATRGVSAGVARAANFGIGIVQGVAGGVAGQASANALAEKGFHKSVNWKLTMGVAAGVGAVFGGIGGAARGTSMKSGFSWFNPRKGFSEPMELLEFTTSTGNVGTIIPDTGVLPGFLSHVYNFKNLFLRYIWGYKGGMSPPLKDVLFPSQLIASGAAFTKDFIDDDVQKTKKRIENAYSTTPTHQGGFIGDALFGIHNGQAVSPAGVQGLSNSGNGVVRQWVGKEQSIGQ